MDIINIAEILNDKPNGMKLYTPICGDVWLVKAERDEFTDKYPITVSRSKDDGIKALNTLAFTAYGKYADTGECLIFPSKKMRDWEKFIWERGDVLIDNYGISCMFNGWTTDDYTQFHSEYSITLDPSNEQTFYKDKIFNTKDFCKAGAKEQKNFIANLEKEYKGKLNPETLEIEKESELNLKDGDVVFLNINGNGETISIFQKFDNGRPVAYASLFRNDNLFISHDQANCDFLCQEEDIQTIRLATEEEKQTILSKLAKIGKKWNPDIKRVEDLSNEHKFKPFDKVLIRDDDEEAWRIAFFSYFEITDPNYPYHVIGMNSSSWAQCIPYEGNEELANTSNKPKEGDGMNCVSKKHN